MPITSNNDHCKMTQKCWCCDEFPKHDTGSTLISEKSD